MGLYDFTFYDLIDRNAVCFGDSAAWFEVDDHRTMTFVQYKEMVDRMACGLQRSNIKKGDRIGVLGKNSREYFILYGAAAALGAIVLPVNWRLSPDEIHFNLNDCEPEVLFVDARSGGLLEGGSALLTSAFDAGIIDRVVLFYAPMLIGGDDALPRWGGEGTAELGAAPRLRRGGRRCRARRAGGGGPRARESRARCRGVCH